MAEKCFFITGATGLLSTEVVAQLVIPVVGDLSSICTLTHVIHCAADTGLQKSKEELWNANVELTRRVVKWAERLPCLQRFTYVSTAYVAGTKNGRIMEDAPLSTQF